MSRQARRGAGSASVFRLVTTIPGYRSELTWTCHSGPSPKPIVRPPIDQPTWLLLRDPGPAGMICAFLHSLTHTRILLSNDNASFHLHNGLALEHNASYQGHSWR